MNLSVDGLTEEEQLQMLQRQSLGSGGSGIQAHQPSLTDVEGPTNAFQQQSSQVFDNMRGELGAIPEPPLSGDSDFGEAPTVDMYGIPENKPQADEGMGLGAALWDATGKAAIHGVGKAAQETVQFGYDVLNFFDDFLGLDALDNEREIKIPGLDNLAPRTAVGQFVSPAVRFITGFIGAGKILGATKIAGKLGALGKAGKYGTQLLQGAMADTVVQNPHEGRLADLIQSIPALQNPITEYLSQDDSEGHFEARLKNAIEGLGLGLAADAVFKGIKSVRASRKVLAAGKDASKALQRDAEKTAAEAAEAAAGAKEALDKEGVLYRVGEGQMSLDDAASHAGIKTTGVAQEGKAAASGFVETAPGIKPLEPKPPKPHLLNTEADHLNAIQDRLETLIGMSKRLGIDARRTSEEILYSVRAIVESGMSKRKTQQALNNAIEAAGLGVIPKPEKVELNKLVKNIANRLAHDVEPSEFKSGSSIMNASRLPRTEQQLADAITATFKEFNWNQEAATHKQLTAVMDKVAEEFHAMGGTKDELYDLAEKLVDKTENLNVTAHMADSLLEVAFKPFDELYQPIKHLPIAEQHKIISEKLIGLASDFERLLRLRGRLGTNVGRGLEALKHIPTPETIEKLSGIPWTVGSKKGMLTERLKSMTPEQRYELLTRICCAKDKLEAMKMMIPDTRTGKLLAASNEVWLNGILSSPATHLVNVMSSAFKLGVMMPVEAMLGVGAERLMKGNYDQAVWNEGAKAYAGMAHAFSEAFQMAKLSFKLGHNIFAPANTIVENQVRMLSPEVFGVGAETIGGKMIENVGMVVNLPTRFLMATDEFFKQLAARSKIFTDLYTEGASMFVKGQESGNKEEFIGKYIKEKYPTKFQDVLSARGNNTIVQGGYTDDAGAFANALEATWTKGLPEGSFSRWLQQGSNRFQPFKRIVPFVRTPANILYDAMAHTPLIANSTAAYKEAIKAGGREAARARGKVMFGGMIWATGMMAATSGILTGGGPKNKAQREMLLETGWRPYSIKVGDSYVSYSRFEPFASLLGTIGDFAELCAAYEVDGGEAFSADAVTGIGGAAVFSLFYNLSSKTYAQGISDLMAALMDKDQLNNYIKDQALSYIPSFVSSAKKISDPEIKEVRGLIEEAMTRIPIMSKNAPTKYSWLTGEPILVHGGMISGFSPVVWDKAENNEIAEELTSFPRAVSGPQRDIGGVKLTSEQLSDYQRLHGNVRIHGKTLMEALQATIDSDKYDKAREFTGNTKDQLDDPRFLMLQDVVQEYRMKARIELMKIYPELRDQIRQGRNQGPLYKAAAVAQLYARDTETVSDRRKEIYDAIIQF